ncbi:MAG: RluA family pseudouridine synthase [Candidatus Nealsonbacteria bacterium]
MKIIYEDENIIVFNKEAGVVSDDIERRVHRLDKDTSGILLAAKNDKALEFLQKQFKEREVKKRYMALVEGNLKDEKGTIETLVGRSQKDRRKQKAYLPNEPSSAGKRKAVTKYKVLQRFKSYDLIEVEPQTGRKHQIRCHLSYINHPIAGDKLYGFKNQKNPKGLTRQFLHASYLKIILPDGKEKEFRSDLPEDLKKILNQLYE